MKVVLCSVPVESPGSVLRRERSEGPKPIMPKVAITSLNHWAKKHGFDTCDFFDVDMHRPKYLHLSCCHTKDLQMLLQYPALKIFEYSLNKN